MHPWVRIRRQLYLRLKEHVEHLLGDEVDQISKYQNEYVGEFNTRWKISSRDQLIQDISKSDYLLIGDFHALQQSQKAQLRILKSISVDLKLILGVEFFEAKHQKLIDRYMAGALSEREFLRAIKWQKSWGFPWEHYRPIIRWAQKRKIRVVGLNQLCAGRSVATLAVRDRFAADRICDLRKQNPEHLIAVIFGDLHLAQNHLPRRIRQKTKNKRERILTVFQNSEDIYFKLLEKEVEVEVDVVKLSVDQYCLLNVPPWVKWQNYLLFLENHLDQEIRDGADYQDEVQNYLQILEHDLEVTVPVGSFSVVSAQDRNFWTQVKENYSMQEQKFLQGWLEKGVSFFLPELATAFLSRPSVNHAAQVAMAILHAHLSGRKKNPVKMPEDFLKLIWLEAVQYFGTKIINPKRKTDTLQDLKTALAIRLPDDQGKEALQLALQQKMRELLLISGVQRGMPLLKPRRSSSYQEAARLLGGMLGEKLFLAYRKKVFSKKTIVSLLSRSIEISDFSIFYGEALELIEGLPEPFLSKTEKL